MNKFMKIFAFLILNSLFITIYFTHVVLYSKDSKELFIDENKIKNFDQYCDEQGEWESIGTILFFKRSAVFYFIDASFFSLHFIKNSYAQPNFTLSLFITLENQKLTFEHKINQTQLEYKWKADEYELNSLQADFNLSFFLLNNSIGLDGIKLHKDAKIEILIEDTNSTQTTKFKLNSKLKYLKNTAKPKGSLVCSKCLYLTKDYAKNFEWWIETNKESGYDNIAFCNHTISNDVSFIDLFSKHKSYLLISELRCVPNLLTNSESVKYFDSFKKLTSVEVYKVEVINQLILTECYLNYFDKYKFVAIVDPDEAILMNKHSEYFELDRVRHMLVSNYGNVSSIESKIFLNRCDRRDSKIENYLGELNRRSNLSSAKSFYFGQGYFIKNSLMHKIAEKFEDFFNSTAEFEFDKVYFIVVIDNQTKSQQISNYTFTISNLYEFMYAKGLFQTYKSLIRPYLDQNKDLFSRHVDAFNRLFYITGEITDFSYGKSVHNTSSTFDITIHHANKYVDENSFSLSKDKYYLARSMAAYHSVPYDLGHLSHFRAYFHWDFIPMSVLFLNIELNYFNCYFRPIVNRLASRNDL